MALSIMISASVSAGTHQGPVARSFACFIRGSMGDGGGKGNGNDGPRKEPVRART